MEDATRRFTAIDNRNETREILSSVYDSLKVKGYNPINQLVGYIISEDPTYITNYNNARSLICTSTATSCCRSLSPMQTCCARQTRPMRPCSRI